MTQEVEWKKVSAELLILSLIEARPRHGYEISKLIEQRSTGLSASMSPPSIHCFIDWKGVGGFRAAGWKRAASVAGVTTD